ncbi:MAG: extracellular solute-binding protein [Anaerolineae bacterium]|nr:extracellular solute-binding protein [Anaerolineae bacterium]
MKHSRRFLIAVLAVALVLMAVSSVRAQDKVTVTWWHINTGDPGLTDWQTMADKYMADHPNVSIEITVLANEDFKARLATVMQGGDPPDLFQSWGGGVLRAFAEAGLVRDISAQLEGEWKDSFAAQSALALYADANGTYGVPWTWGAVGFFYNKALFAKAGIDTPPATWSEFLTDVQKLKDAGIQPISLGESEKWPGHFWWVYLAVRIGGQEAFDAAYGRTGSFADAPYVEAGKKLQELIALEPFADGFLGLTYNDQSAAMGNGEAAMELMGQWAPDVERSNSASGEGLGEDLGWFPFPAVEGGKGDPSDVMGGGDGFAVGKNAEDEAVDFLRFLTSKENQLTMVGTGSVGGPVIVGTEESVKAPLDQVMAARNNAKYFQLYYDQFLPPAVGEAVNDAVETLFAGTASPEEAAQAIEDVAAVELQK